MADIKKARELLAREILNGFRNKITGEGIDRIVGNNPENVLLVGKLMSTDEGDTRVTNTSKTFIESIGVDFYVEEKDVRDAEITLIPQGNFYYRAIPTIEEQQEVMLKEINDSQNKRQFDSFDEVIDLFKQEPEFFVGIKIKLVPIYKKVSLNPENVEIAFKVSDILKEHGDYGFIDERHIKNTEIEQYLQELQQNINDDSEAMTRVISEPTEVKHLISDDAYSNFIKTNANQKVQMQNQNWKIYFDIQIKKISGQFLVSCHLVNNSTVLTGGHKSRKNDKFTIETMFNSGIRIKLVNANFCPIELDFFEDDYKYTKTQYAISNNCSVEYIERENILQTNHLPVFDQYRLITNDELAVEFSDLINNPIGTLHEVLEKMNKELDNWRMHRKSIENTLTEKGKQKINEEIHGFEDEISNFRNGISVIESYPMVKKAFIYMNKAFSMTSKKISTWRLFQIVFIVSMVPDIVACDKELMPDDEKEKTHLSSMALLYFPTGGGKTEAFLGVLVFNLFFDRYRGKCCGVTSILRYPFRLLSVQQVQRLANILAQSELIRREDPEIKETECFSLGYFVGDNNTPNTMRAREYNRFRSMAQAQRDEHRILDICPFCGEKTVHINADETRARLVHYCDNPECPSQGDLPLYIVDSEIYRYLPSAIISTVDKLAIVGCNANFRNLLNGAEYQCPAHGYTSKKQCIEKGCNVEVQDYKKVDMYDPAPTLFIQDELHLIRESLGTYASHYESFIKYFIKNVSKSRRDTKIIGATATISSYQEQVYHLYERNPVRFPCESPFIDKNFYAKIDKNDLQRQILGYAPYGKAIVNSVVYSLKYMREVVFEYYKNPLEIIGIPNIDIRTEEEALEILKDYWIFLEYNNVKRDGNNVDGAIKTPVNEELIAEGVTPFKSRAMTGDESFQDVRDVLAEVENSDDVYNGINLITATSMISHGVDADRFNVMFFYGIPGNMAEYIQAYSRTGRKHSSIVIDLIRPTRETDQSYLKNFISMHRYKDLLVEPVPINRWASKAIDNTLPGIFTGLLLTSYDPELQYSVGSLFFMKSIAKAINDGSLKKDQIVKQLKMAYGCTEEDGNTQDLGNQYGQKIVDFADEIFVQIADRGWTDENIFAGFKLLGYRIMNSLRDTDAQLIIELE